jgi:predicted AlkP superfamily phosphohydrolase/phosphomutase
MNADQVGCKVLVIGLDGATFDLIEPWVAEGKLPTFARLLEESSFGRLESVPNWNSAAAWTSFMTGKNPGKHGIYYFFEQVPGSYDNRYINGGMRDSQTLWSMLSEAGKTVGVMNVPMTYPAEKVNGFLISGVDAPGVDSEGFSHPPDLINELESAVGSYVPQYGIGGYVRTGRIALAVEKLRESIEKRLQAARYLMKWCPWDLFVVVFTETDAVQHLFWAYMDEQCPEHDPETSRLYADTILNIYQDMDRAVGELMHEAGDSTTIIMSDHGFGFELQGPYYLNLWLEAIGMQQSSRSGDGSFVSWLRNTLGKLLTGTIRHGYRQADRFLSREIKQRLIRMLPQIRTKVESLEHLGLVDWSKTKAYSDQARNEIWINLKGRQPLGTVAPGQEYEKVRDQLIRGLYGWRDIKTGEPIVERVDKREDIYTGPHVEKAPDLLVTWRDVRVSGIRFEGGEILATSLRKSESLKRISGGHRKYGIFSITGQNVKQGFSLNEVSILDIAPTILYLMGQPLSRDLDGKVIVDAFEEVFWASHKITYSDAFEQPQLRSQSGITYSEEDAREIEERLRGLGYVE